jgi:hexosaminidase
VKLLPLPRSIKLGAGSFLLPKRVSLQLDAALPAAAAKAIAERLQSAGRAVGVEMVLAASIHGARERGLQAASTTEPKWTLIPIPTLASEGGLKRRERRAPIRCALASSLTKSPEHYTLTIDRQGVHIAGSEPAAVRAGVATLRQLIREHGRRLPCLKIRDWPDFPRRGFMLDISRGRVPNLATLLDLAEHLADCKINELQLYTEHTFAYQKFKPVWRSWGALTGAEIKKLDAHCRWLGIDLVPNQNSFGHLREWLAHPPLKPLGEVAEPYEGANGEFLRYPGTLAPLNPGTLPFVRGLFDELLPNFSSSYFNVGCDETWDLGRGQSKAACERLGKGRVYLDFVKKIHTEVRKRGRTMMFWGDIILNHPELIPDLPKDIVALNWGYEAGHPFQREAALFAQAKIPFYVCPGTSTWMTLIGKHDNAFINLRRAAEAGRKHGALGYLITDWGDGGHPQPLAVSWPLILAGAALSWCGKSYNEDLLAPALSRDIFQDPTQRLAKAALALGVAHQKLKFTALNETPLGTVITAPPPAQRELFCRNGLKHFATIPAKNIRASWAEIEKQQTVLEQARPTGASGKILGNELKFAARMAVLSCQYMLWQQACAAGKNAVAKKLASSMTKDLRKLDREFTNYWSPRNKATPRHCSAFFKWRLEDLTNP